ncbi:MAG TPA: GMC family oxidoreductase [Puia sp.]|nr:GMC family oxidoreductase [Puia sp.]
MPFIDYNTTPFGFDPAAYDVIIVGAGAAGILLAVELTRKHTRVLLVEAGHFTEDQDRQVLNEVEQTGKTVTTAVWGRKRAIGGTTIAWGGQSLPFGPIDFEKRSWVANSGWPLAYEELEPYYVAANRFMNIDELDYEDDILRLLKMKRPGFDEKELHHHFSKWAPEPDFRKMYEGYLLANVTVLYNAVLTRLHDDGQSMITGLTITNFRQEQMRIHAPTVILATGGIEANRTLLNQRQLAGDGPARFSEWLGKCFMEHPCIEVGDVLTDHPWRLQKNFNTHIRNHRKYSIRFSLAAEAQRQRRLLNGSASILFQYDNEKHDPYLEVKQFLRQGRKISLKRLPVHHLKALGLGAASLALHHFIYKHKSHPKLIMMMEQEPIEDSYIGLSAEKDRFGLPRAAMHWKITPNTWRTVVHLSRMAKTEIEKGGFGKVALYDHIDEQEPAWANYLSDVNHHMGGTRMSTTAAEGIVDTDLRVWGFSNLFLCSTSVFPTGSHSNPTLTLLALAQRLANKLSTT